MKILILLVLPQIFRSSYDRILKMKEYFNEPTELKFQKEYKMILEKKWTLDSSKKGTFKIITPKFLKKAADLCSSLICDI